MDTTKTNVSLYGGWPLTPSKRRLGELALTCPSCGSQDITITGMPGAFGTGPGGRWRMGDQGGSDFAVCPCGAKGHLQKEGHSAR